MLVANERGRPKVTEKRVRVGSARGRHAAHETLTSSRAAACPWTKRARTAPARATSDPPIRRTTAGSSFDRGGARLFFSALESIL
ncbi:hypothetical protein EVAR_34305_1 [Eumeta japonica]|uniref:Uncharacterized protein n=1 Tax=Eumeta variegata TaxID=151549 RepID=A0A4C1VE76_EUMVA|nr:hypothetical protein EVAR_34305_1 [Eumeta japonica]